jgi:hypothetical protein
MQFPIHNSGADPFASIDFCALCEYIQVSDMSAGQLNVSLDVRLNARDDDVNRQQKSHPQQREKPMFVNTNEAECKERRKNNSKI